LDPFLWFWPLYLLCPVLDASWDPNISDVGPHFSWTMESALLTYATYTEWGSHGALKLTYVGWKYLRISTALRNDSQCATEHLSYSPLDFFPASDFRFDLAVAKHCSNEYWL
ncbi:hypothetical protein AARAC_001658, partial [Aspergillus arachidicola]